MGCASQAYLFRLKLTVRVELVGVRTPQLQTEKTHIYGMLNVSQMRKVKCKI